MSDSTATVTLQPDEAVPQAFGSLASSVAITFTTRVVIVICTLGTSVIIAHWLGPEGTGALAVLNVTAALALQLGSAGIPSATIYFVAKDRKIVSTVWINGLLFSLAVGFVIALGLMAMVNLRPTIFNGVPAKLVVIISISIPFQLITLLGLNLLLAIDRIRLMNYLDALSALLFFINAIAVLIVWRGNLTNLVWFNVGAAVIASVVLVGFVARVLRQGKLRPEMTLLKRMLVYGIKFYVCIF